MNVRYLLGRLARLVTAVVALVTLTFLLALYLPGCWLRSAAVSGEGPIQVASCNSNVPSSFLLGAVFGLLVLAIALSTFVEPVRTRVGRYRW